MAGKDEQQLSIAQLSEISTIRNILMGQQMSEYEHSFTELNNDIVKTKEHFSLQLSNLSNHTDERLQKLEKEMIERFHRLEKLLPDHVNRLDEKLLFISKTDKNDLGKMLADLSKKLISE